jgi:crotonobetaine/carnitine-CoA ligase
VTGLRSAQGHPAAGRDLATLNVRDLLEQAVRAAPNETFLIHGQETISYGEFNRRVDRAAFMWHELGIRKGDRVAFMLENRPEFLYAWLGLAKIGAILVAINTRWRADEVTYLLNLTEPRLALVGDQYREVFRSVMPAVSSLEAVLSLGPDEGFTDYTELYRQARPEAPEVQLVADDVITLISTSGTTGRPKAVMQTHGNFVLTGEGYADWLGLRPRERIYLCLPLFHINSQAYSVMGPIVARASIVLVQRFSVSRFWSDITSYKVDVFNFIGAMMAMLLQREPVPEERQHTVRVAYGAPIPPDPLRREIEERFGLNLLSGFGMSETTFGLVESLKGERRRGSIGKPRQHVDPRIVNEARVVDDEGHDIPAGEAGELILRSPVMMKGYFRDPEQTAQTIRDGWLYTGDLVRKDEDGFFYYVDRKKDIIRRRGENISSSEVEQILNLHPAVQESAVIGIPSELTDEDVVAFVVPRPGNNPDAGELIAWCDTRLADFKVPSQVWLIESLPKTETERVEKHRLRRLAQDRLSSLGRSERLVAQQNKVRIRRWFEEHLNRGVDQALAGAGEYLAKPDDAEPDIRYVFTAFPDSHYTLEDMIAEGDKLVVRWTSQGTHCGEFMGVAPTGRRVTARGISIYRMDQGKIAEEWFVVDRLGLLEQLGATP